MKSKKEIKEEIAKREKHVISIVQEMFAQIEGEEMIRHLQYLIMNFHNPDRLKEFIKDNPEGAGEEAANIGFLNALFTDHITQLANEQREINHLYGLLDYYNDESSHLKAS